MNAAILSAIETRMQLATIVPDSYPALESETYLWLDGDGERETLVPGPHTQMTLELACLGLDVEFDVVAQGRLEAMAASAEVIDGE